MSDWKRLNQCRVPRSSDRIWGSEESDGFNGAFHMVINGLRVRCIASDGHGWQHVSVSVFGNTMTPPSWSVMCQVKDLFWEPQDWVVQFHPAESEYINNHPGVLHLWRCLEREFPQPDRILVGFKDQGDIDRINSDPLSPIKIL